MTNIPHTIICEDCGGIVVAGHREAMRHERRRLAALGPIRCEVCRAFEDNRVEIRGSYIDVREISFTVPGKRGARSYYFERHGDEARLVNGPSGLPLEAPARVVREARRLLGLEVEG